MGARNGKRVFSTAGPSPVHAVDGAANDGDAGRPPDGPAAGDGAGAGRPRARERLRAHGPEALSQGDLLSLILGSGTRGRSAGTVGHALAVHGLAELAEWPAGRWLSVAGIGPARAAALVAAFELGRRAARPARAGGPIRGPEDVLAHVGDLARARREHFIVLLLNARNELQARETVSIGTLNASIVHPREVFRPAILHSAASVVLVHNHPSGDPEPSEEDLGITKRLVQVGELIGIGVLDHVIVGERGTVSFRARQLL